MTKALEAFTSLTGWVAGSGSTISAYALNADPDYIAGRLAASVVFKVPAGNLGKKISKTVSVNLTGYDELVLSVWSRRKAGSEFNVASDFEYSIAIEGTKTFYLPTFHGFGQVTIALGTITAATKVEITALHNDEDYLILSGLYGVKEEMPLDVMQAVVDEIAYQATLIIPGGKLIGTSATVLNATNCAFSSMKFLDRYAVVSLAGTSGTETHQIDTYDEETGLCTFNSSYDGVKLLYTQTAQARLLIPAVFGTTEKDLVAPGIAVWTMAPEPLHIESDVQREVDTFEVGGTFADRRDDMYLTWPILIDCESRHNETLALASRIVRMFLGRGAVYINARKYDFDWTENAVEVLPDSPVQTLPKVQYALDVIVRERREARQTLPEADTATLTVTISEEVLT
jgi:hypothetical protein